MAVNIQNVQAFKFNYDVCLQKISLAISFPCKIQVTMKRGTQKIESQQFELENGAAKMNQTLNLQTNLYLDMDKKTFIEKKATFTILIITPKGQKVAGTCQIDLANYARNRIPFKTESLKLDKCPDKNSIFTFDISTSMIAQVEFDGMSMSSVASKAQNEYLSHDDVKKQVPGQQHSRNPSQTNLQNDSEIKSPIKEISQPSSLTKSLHQRNNSQIKEAPKQQENQNNQPSIATGNGQHKEEAKVQKQLEIMQKQIDELQQERVTSTKKIDFLSKSLAESEEKKNELLKEKSEFIKQINYLNELVRNQSSGDEVLKKQCQNYERQIQEKSSLVEKKDQLIQELSMQVKKLQEDTEKSQKQISQNADNMKTILELQQQIVLLKKSSSQSQSNSEDQQLKLKIEEQKTIIMKLQSQLEQTKQETNDTIRVKVNEIYTQQQSKIEELEQTNNKLRVSITKNEQNDKLISEKQLLLEKLQRESKNVQEQSQTIEILSNELVKSKQKLGDIYNRAIEIGVYEKLLQI